MIEEVEGIIINERVYGETSKIINILTKEKGIIGVMAKGSRSIKSPLRSVTTKLTYGKFNIYYKENKLSILKSVDIINNLRNIQKDLTKISYATYLLELTEQVIKQNSKDNIYKLLLIGLLKINDNFDAMVITNLIEFKYLEYLGVKPIIDKCSICGSTSNIITISAEKGGYLCQNCWTNEKKVSDKTIKLLRMFYYINLEKIEKTNISEPIKKEINEFLDEYYDRYTGLYLKSKHFLKNLNKLNV